MTDQKNPLFQGILSDAEEKSRAIIGEANDEAAKILEDAKNSAEKARETEQRSTNIRLEALRLKEESARRNVDRLASLRSLNAGYDAVMERVNEKLKDKLADRKWTHDVLVEWIAEAAAGLGLESAVVSSSVKSPADDDILREAEAMLKEKAGVKISLSQSSMMCPEFGIVLSSPDGKISYDNRLSTRMRRREREIRTCVQEMLCKEG